MVRSTVRRAAVGSAMRQKQSLTAEALQRRGADGARQRRGVPGRAAAAVAAGRVALIAVVVQTRAHWGKHRIHESLLLRRGQDAAVS